MASFSPDLVNAEIQAQSLGFSSKHPEKLISLHFHLHPVAASAI
jgi:hypothetical protein